MANTIEQYGITWTFDKELSLDGEGDTYRYGQFVNGDYWVVGPVDIVSITPETTINASSQALHGSMINPLPFTTNDENQQGYDGRIIRYDASLNVAIGVSSESPLTVPVGSSLVSTISDDPVVTGERGRLQTAAVLTVLAEAPAAGSFRPPYCGEDKFILNEDAINYDLLGSVVPAVNPSFPNDMPSLETVEGWFERVWLDHHGTMMQGDGQYLHPRLNMPFYSRDMDVQIGVASLMLHCNYTNMQKRTLLIRLLQVGIDNYGVVASGGRGCWKNSGGHSQGRKWPILFAGMMLDYAGMKNIGQKSGNYLYTAVDGNDDPYWPNAVPPDYIHFGQDDQTTYVSQHYVDATHSVDLVLDATSANPAKVFLNPSLEYSCLENGTTVTFFRIAAGDWNTLLSKKQFVLRNYDSDALSYTLEYGPGWGALEGQAVDTSGYSAFPKIGKGWNAQMHSITTPYDTWRPDSRTPPIRYKESDIGLPEWNVNNATSGAERANHAWETSYKGLCTVTMQATQLAALMMTEFDEHGQAVGGAKVLWNHNAYFDWTDRWFTATAPGGEHAGGSRFFGASGRWTTTMWDTYRADYGPLWTAELSVTAAATGIRDTEIDLKATISGGVGTPSIQWQQWNGEAFVDINGATTAIYTVTGLSAGIEYTFRVVVEDEGSPATQVTDTVVVSTTGEESPSQYLLQVGSGITVSGAEPVEGNYYTEDAVLTLTAIEGRYTLFTGWSGDASGKRKHIQITMNSAKNITANFVVAEVKSVNIQNLSLITKTPIEV